MKKYKIGYLDEESQWIDKFMMRFNDYFDIYTFKLDAQTTIEDIIKQVIVEGLDCLVADFELKEADTIQFNGDEVIEELRSRYPFFPVFIITSKDEDDVLNQVEDNDIVRLKDELDSKPDILKHRISNKIESYYSQIEQSEKLIQELVEKRKGDGLSPAEEQTLTDEYSFLGKINPEDRLLPDSLLQPESITKLNEFSEDAKLILEALKNLQ
jgi:DNA-binding NarL/FixJ family response regulator